MNDSFKKIIVIGEESPVIRDESGITTLGIYDFLLKDNSLELQFQTAFVAKKAVFGDKAYCKYIGGRKSVTDRRKYPEKFVPQ